MMEEFKINSKFAYTTRAEDRNRIIIILPNVQELERPRGICLIAGSRFGLREFYSPI